MSNNYYKIRFLNKMRMLKKIRIMNNVSNSPNTYSDSQESVIKNKINLDIGFIILRYVNSKITNTYWIKCYNCIRKYYPENKIMIIDDNSNPIFLTRIKLYKTTIINSEYPGRGELLPYYYYLNNKFVNKAVIIHDSVFINRYINFNVDDYKLLWSFEHKFNRKYQSIVPKILKVFNDPYLIDCYNNKQLWKGCFGAMSIVSHEYLSFINSKYNLDKLLNYITNRNMRMCFERIIGCLLQIHKPYKCLLGNIHHYCPWNIKIHNINREKIQKLPLIKVWTGR